MEWLLVVTAIANAIAAVLAWAAKLWWGKEYGAAKDEIIRAKDAQIETLDSQLSSLRELTPMRIREYFISVRQQLEEYNDLLQRQLDEAAQEIERKNKQIMELAAVGDAQAGEIERLQIKRRDIEAAAARLQIERDSLAEMYESPDAVVIRLPRIDPSSFVVTNDLFSQLSEQLSSGLAEDFARISVSLQSNLAHSWSTSLTEEELLGEQTLKALVSRDMSEEGQDRLQPDDRDDFRPDQVPPRSPDQTKGPSDA